MARFLTYDEQRARAAERGALLIGRVGLERHEAHASAAHVGRHATARHDCLPHLWLPLPLELLLGVKQPGEIDRRVLIAEEMRRRKAQRIDRRISRSHAISR